MAGERATAQAFVAEVRDATVCTQCGRQPVEWHREEHRLRHQDRVAQLAVHGASVERIQREMDDSVALCRSCHMKLDGRAGRLTEARPYKAGSVHVGPKPCLSCGRPAKPTRRGLCRQCYDAQRRPR